MPTVESVKAKIQGLINKANAATSRADTQLSPAVDALIAGYGSGGEGGFIDVTELPTEDINEDAVYRLTEEKELTLWLAAYMEGAEFNMSLEDFFTMMGMNSTLTLTVVETLPDIMTPTIPGDNIYNCYILESTGIAYISYDGTSATAVPLGEEMLAPGADKGWINSADDIVIDTSTDNASLYTIRHGAQQGLFTYSDGWYELEKTLETTEKPREPRVYMIVDGEAVDFLEYAENSGGSIDVDDIYFVDELPLSKDGMYVLNATGFLYLVSGGRAILITDVFSGNVCYGWVDSVEEMDTTKSGAVYALRGSKTDVIYKVGENGTTNEVYIHENDEWQEYVEPTPTQEKTVDITENGTMEAVPDEGYALSKVIINTNVESSGGDGAAIARSIVDGTITEYSDSEATTVRQYAFYGCSALQRVSAPKAGQVGQFAFHYCGALQSVEFPEAWRIGSYAFEACTAITSINLPKATSLDSYAFYSCFALKSVNLPKAQGLGTNSFQKCTSLSSIDLPKATSVGSSSFSECGKLTSVNLPEITKVRSTAFNSCVSLTNVNIPKATAIESSAFLRCESLLTMDLPTVEDIYAGAFDSCGRLTRLILRTSSGSLCKLRNSSAFNNCYHYHGTVNETYNPNGDKDGYIYVPRALVDSYKSATNWSTFATQFRALEDYTVDGTITGALDENKI